MCKAKMTQICDRPPTIDSVTYRCSSARQSYSAYCSKVKPAGAIRHIHDGECIPDSNKYRIGYGRPPNNLYYKRCDGRYRNAYGEVLLRVFQTTPHSIMGIVGVAEVDLT